MIKTVSIVLMLLVSHAIQAQRLILTPEIGVQTFSRKTQVANPGNFTYSSHMFMLGAKLQYASKNGNGPYIGAYAGYLEVSRYGDDQKYYLRHLRYRFEAGYQWSLKPIYFSDPAKNGFSIKLQPSIGVAYNANAPGPSTIDLGATKPSFYYNVGATAGLGLLFRNKGKELFNLSFGYTRGFYTNAKESNPAYRTQVGNGFSVRLGLPLTIFRLKR